MRKVVYTDIIDEIKKLMIYESIEGVYLFGYDCLQDTSSTWDKWFENMEDAYEHCNTIYNIDKDDWITISDPFENCQHDFILPTRIKGKEFGKPEWGQYQTLVDNIWVDIYKTDKCLNFGGFTGNERLYLSGLLFEFEKAKLNDVTIATKILKALQFDNYSINQIL